jgi:hypothetical protein
MWRSSARRSSSSTTGEVADLPALAEDRQAPPVVVLELDAGELTLAKAEAEEEEEGNAVSLPRLR